MNIIIHTNYFNGVRDAIPEAPELGKCPHARLVMKYFGINYSHAIPNSFAENWTFVDCDKAPDNVPDWMEIK